MMRAYRSGDPYLEFAKLARLVPPDATKKTHGPQREAAKLAFLAFSTRWDPTRWR